MWLNRWLRGLGWALAGAAGAFVVLVIIVRLVPAAQEVSTTILGLSALGLSLLAFLLASIWTVLTHESQAAAAAHLDVAAGLKERLSTGLYFERSDDEFAQAAVADARQMSGRITVPLFVPIRFPTSSNWAGGGLILAAMVFFLFPNVDLSGKQTQRDEEKENKELVERAKAEVIPMVERELEELADQNPTIKQEFKELQPIETGEIKTPLDVRNQAIKKINDASDQLKQKRDSVEMGKLTELKKMLRQLSGDSGSKSTPVAELKDALAKGDWDGAQKSIESLQQKLTQQPQSEAEKAQAEEIKKQLEQLAGALQKMAENDRKLEQMLDQAGVKKEDAAQAMKNLQNNDMQALQQQLQKQGMSQQQQQQLMNQLMQRCQACQLASKLGSNLSQAAGSQQGQQQGQGQQQASGQQQGGQQGQSGQGQQASSGAQSSQGGQSGASQGLGAASQQLSQMQQLEAQLAELNSAMAGLQSMKNQMGNSCSACNGSGMMNGNPCQGCNGSGMGSRMGQGGGQGGMGKLGRGQGGLAQRNQTPYRTVQQKAKVHTVQGEILSTKFIEGEQIEGEVSDAVVEAVISAQRETSEATGRKPLPRHIQSSRAKYFTRMMEGLPEDKVEQVQEDLSDEQPQQ
jgi:hypothetical protein